MSQTATLDPAVENTGLTIITPTDLTEAGVILNETRQFIAKYKKKYDTLIAKAEKEGTKLTPETDKEINDFLVSAKTCVSNREAARKPYTQKAYEFIKYFTAEENTLTATLCPPLQKIRDASVTQYKKDQAELERKAQLKLDQEKEKITLLADAEQQIRNAYLDILNADKNQLLHAFETADATTIDGVQELLENIHPEFKQSVFDEIKPVISSKILTEEEVSTIVKNSSQGKFDKISAHYKADVEAFAAHLADLISTRREEIAAGTLSAAAVEVKEVQYQVNVQQEAIDSKAEQNVSNQIAAVVMDHKISSLANGASIPKAKTVESYNITILKREGWAEIFKFYYANTDEFDMGKVSLDKMKAFAERYAKAHDVKISSDSLEYEVKYKAQAKKEK